MTELKFQLTSYERAQLENYDRRVEFEADTLEAVEQHVAESEFLTDALNGEDVRYWTIERTDGEEVY